MIKRRAELGVGRVYSLFILKIKLKETYKFDENTIPEKHTYKIYALLDCLTLLDITRSGIIHSADLNR